jgi:hypothetical protein
MAVREDIKLLREHYNQKWKWYLAAIDRLESDIQILWNDYFLDKSKSPLNNMKLIETDKTFQTLKDALDYFRASAKIVEKRLDDLDKQEYAILNSDIDPFN